MRQNVHIVLALSPIGARRATSSPVNTPTPTSTPINTPTPTQGALLAYLGEQYGAMLLPDQGDAAGDTLTFLDSLTIL